MEYVVVEEYFYYGVDVVDVDEVGYVVFVEGFYVG